MTDEKQPVRISEWEVQADRLVEKQAAAHLKSREVADKDGRSYAVDSEPRPLQLQHISPRNPAAYSKAVDALHKGHSDASPEELVRMKRAVERHLDPLDPASKVVRGPVRRSRKTYVPAHLKPDYRAFEKWLLEDLGNALSKNWTDMNFGLWCASKVKKDDIAENDGEEKWVERIDLDRLGFSKSAIAKTRAGGTLDSEEFLSAATGIDLDRVRKGFEILRMGPAPAELERLQRKGDYLSDEELDLCIKKCRKWCGYREPGFDQASAVVRTLFEEMNRRGIDKQELSDRARVAKNTLDSWNNQKVGKRKPPSLTKIAACLEAAGLRLVVVPEAEVLEVKKLLEELEERKKLHSAETQSKKP